MDTLSPNQGASSSSLSRERSPSPSPSPGSKLRRITRYDGPNPFEAKFELSISEKIKIFFMTITLIAPIRFLLMWVMIILATILAVVVTLGHPINEPLPAWRLFLAQPIRLFSRMLLLCAGFWKLDITTHPGAQPRTARVLVSNHVTIFDGFIIAWLLPSSVVCKAPLLKLPLLGQLLRSLQALGVERDQRSSRQKSANQLHDRILDKRFPPLLIFPEGTTHSSNTMIMFKRGVFNPGVPVQPVTLDFNVNTRAELSYTHSNALWYMYYPCCQFANFVKVDFLPLYSPNEEEKTNSMTYAANVRKVMAQHMGIEPTDHSYSDIRLAMLANGNQDSYSSDVIVSDISMELKLKSSQLIRLAKVFLEMDEHRTGEITYQEFCTKLRIDEASEASRRLFSVFDTDDNRVIGFSEFLMGISAAIQQESIEDAIVIMFQMCDWEANGSITMRDIQAVSTNWELANLTMRLDSFKSAIFPFNENERLDFDTFRERGLLHPERIREFLQFMLQQRLNLDLEGIVNAD